MDGALRRIDVCPLAEIRRKLADQVELQPFTEVRLIQGGQELVDGSVLEVEAQMVITKSPSLAISFIESKWEAYESHYLDSDRRFELAKAVVALGGMGEMSADHSAKLLELMKRNGCGDIDYLLAWVVGHCADAEACHPGLCRMLEDGNDLALVALAELVSRSSASASHQIPVPRMIAVAIAWTGRFAEIDDWHSADAMLLWSAVRVLGLGGGKEHESILRRLIQHPQVQKATQRRFASDEHAYSWNEFLEFYGDDRGAWKWEQAQAESPETDLSAWVETEDLMAALVSSGSNDFDCDSPCLSEWEIDWSRKVYAACEQALKHIDERERGGS